MVVLVLINIRVVFWIIRLIVGGIYRSSAFIPICFARKQYVLGSLHAISALAVSFSVAMAFTLALQAAYVGYKEQKRNFKIRVRAAVVADANRAIKSGDLELARRELNRVKRLFPTGTLNRNASQRLKTIEQREADADDFYSLAHHFHRQDDLASAFFFAYASSRLRNLQPHETAIHQEASQDLNSNKQAYIDVVRACKSNNYAQAFKAWSAADLRLLSGPKEPQTVEQGVWLCDINPFRTINGIVSNSFAEEIASQ